MVSTLRHGDLGVKEHDGENCDSSQPIDFGVVLQRHLTVVVTTGDGVEVLRSMFAQTDQTARRNAEFMADIVCATATAIFPSITALARISRHQNCIYTSGDTRSHT